MLNAVWVAVIAAAACWMVLVAVAVYVLMRLGRLIGQTSTTVAGLRARSDAVMDRADAALDASADQLARTDAITTSMDQVTANMAELTGRVSSLAPLGKLLSANAGSPLGRVSAFVYGVRRASQLRGAGEVRRAWHSVKELEGWRTSAEAERARR